jgi:pSer/pThr/pTyr-binding forkhead associated (FHA) protein
LSRNHPRGVDSMSGMWLSVVRGSQVGARWSLEIGVPVMLGRDRSGADIVLEAREISRSHVSVCVREDRRVELEDAGSMNGTYAADGTRLQPGTATVLPLGASFFLAHAGIELGVVDS